MRNFFIEPVISFKNSVILFLLSSSGSIFMWTLSYLYNDPENLQFGHLLATEKDRNSAIFSLVFASIFYGILAMLMTYQLILHYRISRLESWDHSIAMVNVHTPKLSANNKRHTPPLFSSEKIPSGFESVATGDPSLSGRFRAGTASAINKQ